VRGRKRESMPDVRAEKSAAEWEKFSDPEKKVFSSENGVGKER